MFVLKFAAANLSRVCSDTAGKVANQRTVNSACIRWAALSDLHQPPRKQNQSSAGLTSCPLPLNFTLSNMFLRAGSPLSEINLGIGMGELFETHTFFLQLTSKEKKKKERKISHIP